MEEGRGGAWGNLAAWLLRLAMPSSNRLSRPAGDPGPSTATTLESMPASFTVVDTQLRQAPMPFGMVATVDCSAHSDFWLWPYSRVSAEAWQ